MGERPTEVPPWLRTPPARGALSCGVLGRAPDQGSPARRLPCSRRRPTCWRARLLPYQRADVALSSLRRGSPSTRPS
jgi:hypothetical protein